MILLPDHGAFLCQAFADVTLNSLSPRMKMMLSGAYFDDLVTDSGRCKSVCAIENVLETGRGKNHLVPPDPRTLSGREFP